MRGNGLLFVIALLVLAWPAYFLTRFVKQRRRERIQRRELPREHVSILEQNVPLYQRMPEALQSELRGYVNVFLHEKIFVGCDGLEVTDEIRVTVAGNACILLLNRSPIHFDGFKSILIYPDTYVAAHVQYDGAVVTHGSSTRAGESWSAGPLILAWSDVLKGIADPGDGHNVVLHEFAHKVDEENGVVDGLPMLRHSDDYEEWASVLTKEFGDLIERSRRRKNRVMDEYGATSPQEFFAVATESFFERGNKMKKRLPELYQQFEKFYGVDPASWVN